jgi:hypothetical protein
MFKLQLLHWIDESRINEDALSINPSAVEYLKQNKKIIHLPLLAYNSGAIELITEYKNIINWGKLSRNPCAIHLLMEKPSYINWDALSRNSAAIQLLTANQDKINWKNLSANSGARELILSNLEKACWLNLSANPSMVDVLLANQDKICWETFSENTNLIAIEFLKEHPDKIRWCSLSMNPAATRLIKPCNICWSCASKNPELIHLLAQNQDKINWDVLIQNTAIFNYDYQSMAKERTRVIEEELIQVTMHPRKIQAWLDAGLSVDDF